MSDQDVTFEEEQDIVDFFAKQGAEVDEVEDDGQELPESADELKALLLAEREKVSRRNKTIKMREKALDRINEERESILSKLDELSAAQNQASTTETQNQEYKETLEKWRDSVDDDPKKAIDFALWQINETQSKTADFLAQMQATYDQKLEAIQGDLDPEKLKYRSKIDGLRQNEEFADLDDATLLRFIKAGEKVRIPRGAIGGKKAEVAVDPNQKYDEIREQYKKFMNS